MDSVDIANGSLIEASKVQSTAVYNPHGEKLGSIQDVMIDKRSGNSVYAIMSFGGFLGLGADYYPIPWSKLKYDTSLGGYVVDIEPRVLEGARLRGGRNPALGRPHLRGESPPLLWRPALLGQLVDVSANSRPSASRAFARDGCSARQGRVRLAAPATSLKPPCPFFSPSTRARPRAARSCSARMSVAAVAQEEFSQSLSGAGLGRARSRGDLAHRGCDHARGARARRRRRRPKSRPSASPTSARRPCVWDRDTASADRTTPSSGRTGARRRSARASRRGPERACRGARRGWCSIPISRRPRSPGCSTTSPARARAPSAASSPSAPSTAS